MKKIWITGAEGHIGTALLELLEGVEYQLLPTDIHEVDITKIDEVTQFVYVNRPDVIINCAGMTDVAECEKNIDEAYRVNAIGVRNVALAANDIDAKVIQISTDDVFDKESRIPYNEFDTVHPRTIYGKSKEAGEKILTQLLNRFVIIRSSWIYGIGRDFVDEVLRNAAKGGRSFDEFHIVEQLFALALVRQSRVKVDVGFLFQLAVGTGNFDCGNRFICHLEIRLSHVYQIRRSVFSGSDLLNFIFQFIPVGNLDIQFFLIILVGKTHEIVVAVLVFQSA